MFKEFIRNHKLLVFLVVILLLAGTVGLGYRVLFLTFVDNYEMAYIYDASTGEIRTVGRTGYIRATPIVEKVHSIDMRPMQVCITGNWRILNCKLVQFNPEGLGLFLKWHGRADYEGGSCNSSGSCSNLGEILRAYAYDESRTYPFLTILPGPGAMEAPTTQATPTK